MRAVITGCAGFIGSHLTERVLSTGGSVVGIDQFTPTYDTARRRLRVHDLAQGSEFEFIEGDIQTVDLNSLLLDADVVFHLAARAGVRASWSEFAKVDATNVLGTQRVLDAVRGGSTLLVFASSSSVYGSSEKYPTDEDQKLAPISPYGVTKAACEALIEVYVSQFHVRAVTLRYFTVYGPRQRSDMAFTRWITRALRNEPLPILGDGTAVRDFTYVDDVVTATMAAAFSETRGHEVFNVAGGSPVSVNDVIGEIERIIGRSVTIARLRTSEGDPHRTGGSTERIRRALGWEPKWTLAEGLKQQVAWLRGRVDRGEL